MAAEATIDRLQIQVTANSSSAAASIDKLASSLSKLGTSLTSPTSRLSQLNSTLSKLNSTLAGMSNLSKLTQLSSVKVSSTIGTNIQKLATALASMPASAATTLSSVSAALSGFSGVTVSAATVNQLAKLPTVLQSYSTLDISSLTAQMDKLTASITPLATAVTSLAAGINSLPASMRTAAAAARTLSTTNTTLATSSATATTAVTSYSTALGTLASVAVVTRMAVLGLVAILWTCIEEYSDYTEAMNKFSVSLGEYAEEAYEYAVLVHETLGINIGDWADMMSTFNTILDGYGYAADAAYTMSTNLTQLVYDIASFHNLTIEDAFTKVQAGLVGEVEPMRQIGYMLETATLQEVALALGIDESVESMTTAEKAMLRYYVMMTSCTDVQTDMARTLSSPANALRVLSSEATTCAQTIGNLLIPIFNKLLPYIIAVVQIITDAATAIAAFFGIEITFEVAWSDDDDTSSYYSDATEDAEEATAAAEEYKNTVMGFDELHKLNDTSDSSSDDGDDDSSSWLDDFDIPTYDFLDNLDETIGEAIAAAKEQIESLLPVIAAVGAAFLAWKLASGFVSGLTSVQSLLTAISELTFSQVVQFLKLIGGIVLAVAGAALAAYGVFDAWENGVDWANLAMIIGGVAVAAIGLGLAFGMVGAVIAVIVGGVAAIATAINDMLQNGLTNENMLLLAAGFLAVGVAIAVAAAAALGLSAPITALAIVIAVVIALIAAVVTAVVLNWDQICEWVDENVVQPLSEKWSELVEEVKGLASDLWEGIKEIWAGVCEWFTENVIDPLVEWFKGLWEDVQSAASAAWDFISGVFASVASWFQANVIIPVVSFFTVLWYNIQEAAGAAWEFIYGIWEGVSGWFSELFESFGQTASDIFYDIGVFASGCWEIIQTVWEYIVLPFFQGLWESIQTFAGDCWETIKGVWDAASGWVDENVITPISSFFTVLWSTIQVAASVAWYNIKSAFSSFTSWFGGIIEDVGGKFTEIWESIKSGAGDAWQGVQDAFGAVAKFFSETFSAAWQGIIGIFDTAGELFTSFGDTVKNAFVSIANQIISGLNSVLSGVFSSINSKIEWLRDLTIGADGFFSIQPFSALKTITVPVIPEISTAAEGAYGIETGQMFIAREAGPEMVGTIDGKTSVANNEQIVAGIEGGVMRGVMRAMSAASSSSEGGDVTLVFKVGGKELARETYKGYQSLLRSGEIKAAF